MSLWDGTAFKAVGGGVQVYDNIPPNTSQGALWWESDTGNLYVSFDDGNTTQWVQVNAAQGAPNAIYSDQADMYAGFKTSGNAFIVNDKADGTGTNVFNVDETGKVAHGGILMAPGQQATGFVKQKGTSGSYSFVWRVTDDGTSGGANSLVKMTLVDNPDTSLNLVGTSPAVTFYPGNGGTRAGYIQSVNGGAFTIGGDSAVMQLTSAGSGTIYVGPRTSQVYAGARQTISYLGLSNQYGLNMVAESAAGTSIPILFTYPPSTSCGNISMTASAVSYNTTSDARLKEFTGELSGEDAAAIIRADPVHRFNWLLDGSSAVGWSAQDSYAVSQDLATPGDDLGVDAKQGDDGFMAWGVDQAKRTPYLWAALAMALDKIEALEAKVAALEAGGSSGV